MNSAIFGAVISYYGLKPPRRHSNEWAGNRRSDRMRVRKGGGRVGDQLERVNKGSSIIKVQGNESPLWMKLHKEKSRIFSIPLSLYFCPSFSPLSAESIYICSCINLDASARDSRTRANMSRPRARKMHDPREIYYRCALGGIKNCSNRSFACRRDGDEDGHARDKRQRDVGG